MQDQFHVEVKREGQATILAVVGELDLASSPVLEEELARVGEAAPELLVLDLRELVFMDSTGLSVLVKAYRHAEDAGRRLVLLKGGPQIQRLLSLTGLADRLPLVDSLEESYDGKLPRA